MPIEDWGPTAQRNVKKQFLHRAIGEGRGTYAIAALNHLAINKRMTDDMSEQYMIARFEAAANSLHKNRKKILKFLAKTDFNREETPEIRNLIMQDLAEQELTIDLLRVEGMAEDKLPKISLALARMNAYEIFYGEAQGDVRQWSDNDPRIQNSRNKAREILGLRAVEEKPSKDGATIKPASSTPGITYM